MESNEQSHPPPKRLPTWLITVTPLSKAIALFLFIALPCAGFFIGMKYGESYSINNSDLSSKDGTATQQREMGNIDSKTTVSYAAVNGKIVLRYKNKFFENDKNTLEAGEINLSNASSYEWIKLVDRPQSNTRYLEDEMLSFKSLPSNSSFIFVMRWATQSPVGNFMKSNYEVFYFDNTSKKLSNPLSFVENGSEYAVPKIDKINTDGKFISFNMYQCWSCGGHHPETLLLNLESNTTKRIGKVYDFAWGEGDNYSYKEYKVIECAQPTPGECTQDQTTLSTIQGKF